MVASTFAFSRRNWRARSRFPCLRAMRLAFHLGGFGLGFLQHLFQAVLLGDGLDGFFAVGDERALHIPTGLIEHHVGIFNLVHCAIEERFEPGKESFHSVGGVSGES